MRIPAPPLLLVTDRHHARGDILDVADLAFLAGCRWLSLREKDLPSSEQIELLREVMRVAKRHGARIMLHGEAMLAREAGAHGVHLRAGSDVAEARRLLGDEALIGLSIHSVDEARTAKAGATDYVIAGPVFETASKPGYGPALKAEGLARIVQACAVPVIAIGGITPGNVFDCRKAGAAGVAVMGGVMRAKNPAETVTQLIEALQPRPR